MIFSSELLPNEGLFFKLASLFSDHNAPLTCRVVAGMQNAFFPERGKYSTLTSGFFFTFGTSYVLYFACVKITQKSKRWKKDWNNNDLLRDAILIRGV